ncbi:MAG TPA: sugar ABC transporter permease [Jatrophihabitantaceae bacterium]|jgi:multiple sugar transport system permease protein
MTALAVESGQVAAARRAVRRRHLQHVPYLVPLLASLLIWVYGPLAATGVLSLVRWDLTGPATFVGLANYRALLADPAFVTAAGQTVLYAAGMLPLAVGLPLVLAIALWGRPGRAASVYRCLLFVPMVLAPVATAISWQFVLNPLQGVLRGLLGTSTPDLLGDPRTALWTVDVITSGKMIALNVLLFSAALAAIDPATVEAARVDGASQRQITWRVVVPQLARSIVLLAMLTVVYAGQWSFTNIAVLTQGGPQHSTDNVYYRLYTYGFTYFDVGKASAGAVLVVLALAIPLGLGGLLRRTRDAR